MKNIFTIILMMIWLPNIMLAQTTITSEKTITDITNGEIHILTESVSSEIAKPINYNKTNLETGLLWQADAEWAVCNSVGISDITYQTFNGWHYNYRRVSYFGETNNSEWEFSLDASEYVHHDINSAGDFLACAEGQMIHQLDTLTGNPIWTYTTDEDVYNVKITEDKETLYFVSGTLPSIMHITSLNVETSTVNWTYTLPEGEYVWGLEVSANGEKIIIQQKHWLSAYNSLGDVLLQTEAHPNSQSMPSISSDGNKFVVGDQRGYVRLYTFVENTNSFLQTWFWQYPYSGTYNWTTAVIISPDASCIAAGSLNFEGNSVYSGTIAYFQASAGAPLWTNNIGNDEISCIDISANGSVIAAASWGPLNDLASDFWIFNSDSNQPIYEFACTGSPRALDLSADATKCIVGGKAVHSRISGHGGKLYYFDITQPSSVSGIITDASTNLPLEGVTINLGISYSAISNSVGYYTMEDVENGTYTLSCELVGYETFSTEIDVDGAEIIDIELELISSLDHSVVLQNKISISNHPNPFRAETIISYTIPSANMVCIEIYNMQGEKIKILLSKYHKKGNYSVVWNKENENLLEPGIYFCKITAGKFSSVKKMIILE